MLQTTAIRTIDAEQEKLVGLAQKMWDCPETAFNEVHASAWTAELLKEYGFEVETGAYGLPTCVVGRWGSGHPVIGLLGELDACIPEPHGTERQLEDQEIADLIGRFLRSLPSEQRIMFLKRYWYGEDLAAIAAAMGCKPSKVKSYLYSMRNALRAYLEREEVYL